MAMRVLSRRQLLVEEYSAPVRLDPYPSPAARAQHRVEQEAPAIARTPMGAGGVVATVERDSETRRLDEGLEEGAVEIDSVTRHDIEDARRRGRGPWQHHLVLRTLHRDASGQAEWQSACRNGESEICGPPSPKSVGTAGGRVEA